MTNIANLLTEHMAIWTAAETEKKSGRGRASGNANSVYGVKKLRELILELAVRGKLVPQHPNDEPASELLKRIQVEKAKLVADGKLKKEKPLAQIEEDEKPFELPIGWQWVRISDVAFSQAGFAFKSNSFNELGNGLPLIRIRDVGQEFTGTYYDGDYREEFLVRNGDYLISMDGEFRVATWKLNDALLNQRVSRLIFFGKETSQDFVCHFLQNRLRELQGTKAYTTVDHLSGGQISNSVIGLPTLAEQHRIVAKVDELMALCDLLEQQHSNAQEAHETLVSQLLGTLTQSQNSAEFNANWQRIYAHFDLLFTTEASIDALKQTLLQLAVMGKLVPQDPNDEPASELLKRIQVEKGKINSVWLDFNGLEELKKDIPSNWTWIRLGEIADIVRGGSPRPAGDLKFYEGDIPFLKVGDVTRSKGKMVEGHTSTIKPAGLVKTRLMNTRTVLLTNSGATLGVPAICDFETTFNDGIAAFINLSSEIFDEYLYLYLKSISTWFLEVAAQGQGQPNLNTDIIRSTWISVTSISEQKCIVAKVDALMALCDQLKTRIKQANQQQNAIADALVAQAVTA